MGAQGNFLRAHFYLVYSVSNPAQNECATENLPT